jgi:hypothetical protein
MTTRTWIRKLFTRTPRTVRQAPARCRPRVEALEDRLTPSTLGTTALLEGPAAGSDADIVVASGAWWATANASWLHTSSSGTGSGLATFTFDPNPGATRSGTLTISELTFDGQTVTVTEQTLTVTQAGSTYVAANPLTTLASGLVDAFGESSASGVAVDASDNVYFTNNKARDSLTRYTEIEEWHAATGQVTTLVSGMVQSNSTPVANAVAVERRGNVFFTEPVPYSLGSATLVEEWNAETGQVTTLISDYGARGVAVDGSGNVYVADEGSNAIKKWQAAAGQLTTLVPGLAFAAGVAVDGSGSVYFVDAGNRTVQELPQAFVPDAAIRERAPAGSDALAPVLPATASLTGVFAPQSDQGWLTIDSVQGGGVHFSFTSNTGATRTANLSVLGQQITVTQSPPITITVTGYGVTYDGNPHTAAATAVGYGNVDLSADLSLGGTQHTGAGSYTDTWTFHDPTGTYLDASGTVSDTIIPATLLVTADAQVKVAGSTDPTLTYAVSGLQTGDTAATVLTGSLTRDAGETVASYPIRRGTLSANANYTLSFVGSILYITSGTVSLTSAQSVVVSSTGDPVTVTAAQLTASASGFDATLSVAQFSSSPVANFFAAGTFFDVRIGSTDLGASSTVQLLMRGLTPLTSLLWFNGSTWEPVKDAAGHTVVADATGTAHLTLTLGTSPSLASLSGTYFLGGQPQLAASGVNVSATAGAPFSGPVATFTNPLAGTAGSYTATIDWGDGSTSAGVITANGATLTVSGSHTYADPVNEVVHVTIGNVYGYTTTATATATAAVTSLGQGVPQGQTGGIGFWHNSYGQALITSFNGGSTSTALAQWLAATFPNLYGAGAGANNLTGMTNAQVASFYLSQFSLSGPKAEAQVLATALNVYATTSSLGGNAGAAYGFTVSATGLGARLYNVGSDGAAFGVANNTTLNVYQFLQAVNKKAVNGVLYGGDQALRQQCAALLDALNNAGGMG